MRIQVPTRLSDNRNHRFRLLYKKHFNIELSVEQANEEAFRLMSFCVIIIENTPKYYGK